MGYSISCPNDCDGSIFISMEGNGDYDDPYVVMIEDEEHSPHCLPLTEAQLDELPSRVDVHAYLDSVAEDIAMAGL